MKVARFYAPGDIRLEDIPEPEVSDGEVKIRVRNCSTCGTDVKISRSGHPNMTPPQVMGHEIAGEVVEVGAGVEGWAVGGRGQGSAPLPHRPSPPTPGEPAPARPGEHPRRTGRPTRRDSATCC